MGRTVRRLEQLGAVCLLAHTQRRPLHRTVESQDQNPILIIGTTLDPATPYANARRVANLLGNAILLTHDGYGHTSEADPSACVTQATSRYLVQLIAPPKGTICRSDRQPFDPQFGQPLSRVVR